MLEDLWIEELEVEVFERELNGMYGAYIQSHQLIVLEKRLAPVQRRSTLMHELGHAYYGHTESTARTEREASEWAARQMIPACEFNRLTRLYDSPIAVAFELGVLPRDVVNYAEWAKRALVLKMV